MNKYIPYEKLSKKEKRKIDLKFRNNWGSINSITKTIPNKKYIQNKFPKKSIFFHFLGLLLRKYCIECTFI